MTAADTFSTPPPDDRRAQFVACACIAAGAWIAYALLVAAVNYFA